MFRVSEPSRLVLALALASLAAADANHDGRPSPAEFRADAERYFHALDLMKLVHDEDVDYVLDAHQNRIFKRPLEEVVADREQRLLEARPLLDPLRELLTRSPWLAGDEPNQIDYIALGNFLWAASLASGPPLAKDDPLMDWLDRGFDLFSGIGGDSRLYPLAA